MIEKKNPAFFCFVENGRALRQKHNFWDRISSRDRYTDVDWIEFYRFPRQEVLLFIIDLRVP